MTDVEDGAPSMEPEKQTKRSSMVRTGASTCPLGMVDFPYIRAFFLLGVQVLTDVEEQTFEFPSLVQREKQTKRSSIVRLRRNGVENQAFFALV